MIRLLCTVNALLCDRSIFQAVIGMIVTGWESGRRVSSFSLNQAGRQFDGIASKIEQYFNGKQKIDANNRASNA